MLLATRVAAIRSAKIGTGKSARNTLAVSVDVLAALFSVITPLNDNNAPSETCNGNSKTSEQLIN